MSDWLFDLGNTRLKCASLQTDGSVGAIAALAHEDGASADALDAALPARGGVAYVASVAAPGRRVDLLDALARRFERIAIARTQPAFAGLRIAYAQPHKLGVDRWLAMLGAHVRGPSPALVVGVGTALTLDLVDGEGLHRGGRIAPSPRVMREALHARAAQLPVEGGTYAEFADDTEDALASGCEGAALALVERSHRRAGELLGAPPRLLLHGGGAAPLRTRLEDAEWTPDLVLAGLGRWARLGDV
jgi:type III pantothenate kinase